MSSERDGYEEIGKKIKRDISTDVSYIMHQEMGRKHVLGSPRTLNTITPCAACKLLRRRCAQECPFSPYFSPLEPHNFASVHKVFGASNVSKLLREVPENQRADAANSLIYEANVRLKDPVYGCMGVIRALQQQVESLQAELNAVRGEIMRYKYKETAIITSNINNYPASNTHLIHLLSDGAVSIAALPMATPQQPTTPTLPHTSSSSSIYTTPPTATVDFNTTISNDNVSYFG